MSNSNDVSFAFDKYQGPKMLDLKTSVANAIINVCFMVPGNIPSLPHLGVDITQYFYRSKDELDSCSASISAQIQEACGQLISGAKVSDVKFATIKATSNETIFMLAIRILFPNGDDQILGVALRNQNDRVTFNFDYQDV